MVHVVAFAYNINTHVSSGDLGNPWRNRPCRDPVDLCRGRFPHSVTGSGTDLLVTRLTSVGAGSHIPSRDPGLACW